MKTLILTFASLMIAGSALGELMKKPENMDRLREECDKSGFEPYMGQHIDEVPEEIRNPEDATVRILYPNSMATMDFRLDRLNVRLSEDGIILSLRCG